MKDHNVIAINRRKLRDGYTGNVHDDITANRVSQYGWIAFT
jgi:hypothetical protein